MADFYRDRSVLITGATGFMGKVLVEKLLRSCPGLSKIYLLMRPKGGHHVDARLDELLNSKVRFVAYLPFSALLRRSLRCSGARGGEGLVMPVTVLLGML